MTANDNGHRGLLPAGLGDLLPPSKLERILAALDAAVGPAELNIPSFRLHPLKGELRGYWSIWVNGNWRVVFRFDGVDVDQVDYVDYH